MLSDTSGPTEGHSGIGLLDTAVWQTGPQSAIVVLSGELDLATAPRLTERLADLADSNIINLVIDLANLEFIDSSGIAVLVAALEHMRSRGGSLAVRNPNPIAMKIFEITGLTDYLSVSGCANGDQ